MDKVTATYLVHEEKGDLERKAQSIAFGLTIGSWTDIPSIQREQLRRHQGVVEEVVLLPDDEQLNLFFGKKLQKGKITISYPAANFTADLPAILTTIFGKLSLDGEIKLLDIQLTPGLAKLFPGPRFGIDEIRKDLNVWDRPLVMSIFKSVLGRDIEYFRDQLREQVRGGMDIVKDDEILFENLHTPFETRIQVAVDVLREHRELTGKNALYAVNLTGRTFELKEKARRAVELGANALLFNVFSYGLDVLQCLVEDPEIPVPILAHPAFAGTMISSPLYGIQPALLLGKLLRMVGADFVLFPSPYGSVAMEKEQAIGISQSLTAVQETFKRAFPVPSAGIHPGLVPLLIQDFGLHSVINAGGGVHGHPKGAAAGGRAFLQAIDGTLDGASLQEIAQNKEELAIALGMWR